MMPGFVGHILNDLSRDAVLMDGELKERIIGSGS